MCEQYIRSESEHIQLQVKKTTQISTRQYFQGSNNIPIDYLTKNYKSGCKYALKTINSVLLKDGKIINLLEKDIQKRRINCGCVKSNCQAKYCECFRWGQTCSDQCTCIGCKNKAVRKSPLVKVDQTGCNCVKSGCKKKYCQCYQRGKKCGEACNCRQCENKE